MSRGKRYDNEPKLNYKKVFAVIIAIAVIVMSFIILKNILTNDNLFSKNRETSYFTLYENNKWGVINSNGETIIPSNYEEMIIIPNNKEAVFLCTYDINEETNEYKTKVLDKDSKEIFTKYDKVEALENFDSSNNIWYEEDVLKVLKDGKYGLINLNGKEILNCEYDNIYTLKGIENSLILIKEGNTGLANNSGSIIVEPICKEIYCIGEKYTDGYITINQDGKYGVVSYTKKQLLENNYEYIEKIPGEKYFVIKQGEAYKLVNTEGVVVLELGNNQVTQIIDNKIEVIVYKNENLYGAMNISGETIFETKYQELKHLNESYFLAKQNDKCGIIDIENNEKIPFEYTSIYYDKNANMYIAEDANYNSTIIDNNFNIKLLGILAEINEEYKYLKLRIDGEYKYYNFNFEEKANTEILSDNTIFLKKQNDKYGFINKKGETVIDYIYDDATEQNKYGFAGIKKDGLWGVVNRAGEIILEPKYNLDANLIIDFIGKWHLGEDLNMNYYCEL